MWVIGMIWSGGGDDSAAATMEAIEGQIREPALRGLYRYWRGILIDGEGLPKLVCFDFGALEHQALLAEVKSDGFASSSLVKASSDGSVIRSSANSCLTTHPSYSDRQRPHTVIVSSWACPVMTTRVMILATDRRCVSSG